LLNGTRGDPFCEIAKLAKTSIGTVDGVIDKHGGYPKIHLIGYDVTPENWEYFKKGTIDIVTKENMAYRQH
jgi:hypothetical protein